MRHLILCSTAILVLAGCMGDNTGLIMTRDGRMVAETAEISRDEYCFRLASRAAEAAGSGWQATVSIEELPIRDAVTADEWGWRTFHAHLTLVPPAAATMTAAVEERAVAAVREAARYRVRRSADISIAVTAVSADRQPGSQHYTITAGDTWASISTAFYGTPQHWRRIADANPGVDGSHLAAGTSILVPPAP